MGSIENRILITGASGQYGRLAIDGLLAKGIPPSSLLLLTRDPAKLSDYASKGSSIRQGSFDDPVDTLAEAFSGADTMLFISTSRAGQRLPQHQAAVDAAVKAEIKHIVYTSILSAHLENPTALVAKEHRATGIHSNRFHFGRKEADSSTQRKCYGRAAYTGPHSVTRSTRRL